jgi:hydrogenase expression/formation protein HypC
VCLGIPGEIVEMAEGDDDLAVVEVAGVKRKINIGLLSEEDLGKGDWVLIHVGFAMAKIDEEEAKLALESLMMMGAAFTDEVELLRSSNAVG